MYNRYIHSDTAQQRQYSPPIPPPHQTGCTEASFDSKTSREKTEKKGFVSSFLGGLKLDHIDTGDLLLIAVLILLFKESEDEELLIALVLLLIL